MKKLKVYAAMLYLPGVVSRHLFGENHTIEHRMFVGFLVMAVGVFLTKITPVHNGLVHGASDLIGYGLHGIGLHPFLEKITKG